jgi:hypothetical protein
MDFLKVYNLFQSHPQLLYLNDNYLVLAVKALFNNKQYTVCESVITKQAESYPANEVLTNPKLKSAKALILAKCQEALEKKKSAINNYFESLKHDPTNVEALSLLMDSYLVNLPESTHRINIEEQYLNTVQFSSEDKWIKKFFFSFIKDGSLDEKQTKGSKDANLITNFQFTRGKRPLTLELLKSTHPHEGRMDIESEDGQAIGTKGWAAITSENILENLVRKDNIDILAIKAKNAFMKYDIQTAYKLSKEYA